MILEQRNGKKERLGENKSEPLASIFLNVGTAVLTDTKSMLGGLLCLCTTRMLLTTITNVFLKRFIVSLAGGLSGDII
jgi:hypothetical protein